MESREDAKRFVSLVLTVSGSEGRKQGITLGEAWKKPEPDLGPQRGAGFCWRESVGRRGGWSLEGEDHAQGSLEGVDYSPTCPLRGACPSCWIEFF